MSKPSRLLLVVSAFIAALAASAAWAKKPKPALCTDGRFAVAGPPLLGAGGQIVVLESRKVSIGSLCAARKAKLRRTTKGTQLTVVFPKGKCTGIKGRVTLTA